MDRIIITFIVKEKNLLLIRQVKDGKSYLFLPNGIAKEDETIDNALSRIVKEQCGLDVKSNKTIFQRDMEEYYILIQEFTELVDTIHSSVWKSFTEVMDKLTSIYPEQAREKIRLFIERETMTDKLMTLSDYDLLKQEGFITAPLDELGFNNHPTVSAARMNEMLRRAMEMQRRLKNEIKRLNDSSSRYSVILIWLTSFMTIAVLIQIYLFIKN